MAICGVIHCRRICRAGGLLVMLPSARCQAAAS